MPPRRDGKNSLPTESSAPVPGGRWPALQTASPAASLGDAPGCTTQSTKGTLALSVSLLVSVETGFGDPTPLLRGHVDVGG